MALFDERKRNYSIRESTARAIGSPAIEVAHFARSLCCYEM